MTLSDPTVFSTDYEDGSADFTISVDGDDYKFSAVIDGDEALLQYEETQVPHGEIRVAEPRHEVYRALLSSDEMTSFLEAHDLTGARRERH